MITESKKPNKINISNTYFLNIFKLLYLKELKIFDIPYIKNTALDKPLNENSENTNILNNNPIGVDNE